MNELVCNLHMHSIYSDGSGNYSQIANEAIFAGVDVVIITDHNVKVKGVDRYFESKNKKVLLLTGEEVHDQNRMPQKNHTLVIGCEEEVAQYATIPQELIERVDQAGGMTFLAHPFEYALPLFHETDITWENWEVQGFTGLELWNGFSEFKTVVKKFRQALFYAYQPEMIPHRPLPQILAKWDELLCAGKKVYAVGGSDAHAMNFQKGLFSKTIFPYRYHFSTINNHLLLPEPLTGMIDKDKNMVYHALKNGSFFIGNDLPASTRGFSFTAENEDSQAGIGEELMLEQGATIRVAHPLKCDFRLLKDGTPIQVMKNSDRLIYTVSQPGAYRVEALMEYRGEQRGWIYSNPIFITSKRKNNP